MTPRRAYAVAVIACLLGAALVVAAGGQTWTHVTLDRGVGAPIGSVDLDGRELAGPVSGLGLMALAGVAALIATRGWVRRVVGVLLDAAGLWVVVGALIGRGAAHVETVATRTSAGSTVLGASATAWPWIAVTGGALVVMAGALSVVTSRRWASLSRRYDAPRPASSAAEDPWAALDRGDDPTL